MGVIDGSHRFASQGVDVALTQAVADARTAIDVHYDSDNVVTVPLLKEGYLPYVSAQGTTQLAEAGVHGFSSTFGRFIPDTNEMLVLYTVVRHGLETRKRNPRFHSILGHLAGKFKEQLFQYENMDVHLVESEMIGILAAGSAIRTVGKSLDAAHESDLPRRLMIAADEKIPHLKYRGDTEATAVMRHFSFKSTLQARTISKMVMKAIKATPSASS